MHCYVMRKMCCKADIVRCWIGIKVVKGWENKDIFGIFERIFCSFEKSL